MITEDRLEALSSSKIVQLVCNRILVVACSLSRSLFSLRVWGVDFEFATSECSRHVNLSIYSRCHTKIANALYIYI